MNGNTNPNMETELVQQAAEPIPFDPTHYANLYQKELTENILPFWMQHSHDVVNGGYFTCLDRNGRVYDTDKFIWLQGRQVWTFSYMYNQVEKNPAWLAFAKQGADFLEKYGRDAAGNWYFSLTADGRPLMQPYNIFSDAFATMAFAAMDKADPNPRYKQIALDTFENIIRRQHNWKGPYNKLYPGTRPLRNFSLPMILSNLSLELEHILGADRVNSFIPIVVHDVMDVFYQPEHRLILENVNPDGSFSDSFEGRLINPGHAIEAMWFIMDLGNRIGDKALIRKATDIMLNTLEHSWDKEFGGLYYFMDIKNNPLQQLEWDQKLWWVHVETLVGLAKGYLHTGDPACITWFNKVHRYTWEKFRDPAFGEWFGYLNREGEPFLPMKGGKWKGCFHIPRALYQVWKTMEKIQQKTNAQ